MTHTALIGLALKINAPVLFIAIVSFFKCADRTAMFERSFSFSTDIIQRIKERIFVELTTTLKPLFLQPQDEAINVMDDLRPDGEAWKEGAIDPQGTEDYKNALHRLINDYTKSMSDFRSLKTIVDRCRFWAGYLAWSILFVLIMQGVGLCYCGIIDKAFSLCSKDLPVYIIIIFSVVSFFNALIPLPFLLHYHGRIDKYGREYN